MIDLAIEKKGDGKGRSFGATMLAHVTADGLWDGGQAEDVVRPAWAMFAGGDAELRTFVANLRGGRRAESGERESYSRRKPETRVELLKSAGYRWAWQREAEGTLATAYLPSLFLADPGMIDPAGVAFVCLPTFAWVEAQKVDALALARHARKVDPATPLAEGVERAKAYGALAHLFALYLDRRVRCPLVADARFYWQIFVAFLASGLASLGWDGDRYGYNRERPFGVNPTLGYREVKAESVWLAPGAACKATHEAVESLLAEQVGLYFRAVGGVSLWRG